MRSEPMAILFTLGAWLGLVLTPASAQPMATEREIEDAIKRLGDDQFRVREQASDFLWKAGGAAQPALQAAAQSDHREIAYRARAILEQFRLGIRPDTPPEITALINQYRAGNINAKRAALLGLQKQDRHDTVMVLLETEENVLLRNQLVQAVAANLNHFISKWLVDRQSEKAENMLQWAVANDHTDSQLRDYAAFWTLLDKHQPKIQQLSPDGQLPDRLEDQRLLVHLLRSSGQWERARHVADHLGDRQMLTDLLIRLQDWSSLAKSNHIPGRTAIEHLGFLATFQRLAGDMDEFEESIDQIRQLALDSKSSKTSEQACQALMINGQWQDVIDIRIHRNSTDAFQAFILLREQLRFAEAFQAAGIADPLKESASWFVRRAAQLNNQSSLMTYHVRYGLAVAHALDRLGEERAVLELLEEIENVAQDKTGERLQWMFKAEHDLGMNELAQRHAADALAHPQRVSFIFTTLFQDDSELATDWWSILRQIHPDEERLQLLRKLQLLLKPSAAGSDLDLDELARQVDGNSAGFGIKRRIEWLTAILKVCQIQQRPDLARVYVDKLAPHSSWETRLHIGDFWRTQKQWEFAARWYHQAWQADPQNALALYLHGDALDHTGQQAEGRRMMDIAELMPMANYTRRRTLAEGLRVRGLADEAYGQWLWIARFGPYDYYTYSTYLKDAVRYAGEYLIDKHELQAVEMMQRRIFFHLTTRLKYKFAESYPDYIHRIHRTRSLGLLQAGDFEEAMDQAWLAYKALPGANNLPIKLVPKLEAAGRNREANELFASVYQRLDNVCREFPHSAYYRNLAARLCFRCNRQLDEALVHANTAVRLVPDRVTYLDTLAEIHFLRGERERAVELAQQCINMAPLKEYYQRQLERFESEAEASGSKR